MTEAQLSRSAWGLRFVDPATERAYRNFAILEAAPFLWAGTVASVTCWLLTVAVVWARLPAALPWLLPRVGVIVAAMAVFSVFSRWERVRPWLFVSTAATNAIAGLVIAGMTTHGLSPHIGLAAVVLVTYFAFTMLRLPVVHASVAAITYVATFGAMVAAGSFAEPVESLMYAVVLGTAYCTGMLAAAVLERVSRAGFAQQQIIEGQKRVIEQERERADRLLHNVLPEAIAARLKVSPGVIADRFEAVTVLFADVVGFTPMAAGLAPEKVVAILNDVFTRFDALAAQHGVEKIKTIGDAYMAVAGIPTPRPDHAHAAASLALAMGAAISQVNAAHGLNVRLRIGLCTGPAVAGVIGAQKFAYDLWGDTVNTAARMESHGVVDAIHVSDSTASALAGAFALEARGELEIRGKGKMRTWLLRALPPTDRANGNGP